VTRFFWTSPRAAAGALGIAVLLLNAGCRREEITVYRVPREVPMARATAEEPSAPTEKPAPAAARPQVKWAKLPAAWREETAIGSRAATFTVTGTGAQRAEVAVIGFPGMGGTDLQFVNLWRTSLGLGELTDAQLEPLVQAVEVAGARGKLFDITAATKEESTTATNRILVALHKTESASWFIKLTGDAALVEQQRPAFTEFIKGLTLEMPAEAARAAAQAAQSVPAAPAGNTPHWTAPEHWKAAAPGAMQAAKYKVGEGKAAAEITAVFLGGVGGSLKANLDRWRNQLSLPAAAESEVEQQAPLFAELGAGARIVQLSGTTGEGDPADLIVLIVPSGRGTWFYKLMGEKSVVAKEKAALVAFVKSAQP
jgi:hypothetical protein